LSSTWRSNLSIPIYLFLFWRFFLLLPNLLINKLQANSYFHNSTSIKTSNKSYEMAPSTPPAPVNEDFSHGTPLIGCTIMKNENEGTLVNEDFSHGTPLIGCTIMRSEAEPELINEDFSHGTPLIGCSIM
jgi:hypothetical protein